MKLYRILKNSYMGGTIEVLQNIEATEPGLTHTAPTFQIGNGVYAYWVGDRWIPTNTSPEDFEKNIAQSIEVSRPIVEPTIQVPILNEYIVVPTEPIVDTVIDDTLLE